MQKAEIDHGKDSVEFKSVLKKWRMLRDDYNALKRQEGEANESQYLEIAVENDAADDDKQRRRRWCPKWWSQWNYWNY